VGVHNFFTAAQGDIVPVALYMVHFINQDPQLLNLLQCPGIPSNYFVKRYARTKYTAIYIHPNPPAPANQPAESIGSNQTPNNSQSSGNN